MLTNRSGTLYVGVTNNLERRLAEHVASGDERFTGRYALDRLIYVESYPEARDGIAREKQLKGWRRSKKVALVNAANPSWRDLRGRAELP
ncbi:GIY-YIG nuclease family protein [Rubrivirga marina]|nr:GIY-YIG nuclease family protein [Rubrivirga marina]